MLFYLALAPLVTSAGLILVKAALALQLKAIHSLLFACELAGAVAIGLIVGVLEPAIVRGDSVNFTPLAVFVCGLFGAAAFAIRLGMIGRQILGAGTSERGVSAAFGVSGLALLSALYLTFTAVDHWWFFRRHDSGIASPMAMGLADVTCRSGAFRIDGSEVVFRCPTLMILNQRYTNPFIPWPYYVSGRSERLEDKYDRLMRAPK
jgi:hypothetical protein